MIIDQMLSIGYPLIILVVAFIYLFHGIKASVRGQFTNKSYQITKIEDPSRFRWLVWGRILCGVTLLFVSISLAYVFHHS